MIISPFSAQLAGQRGEFPTTNLDQWAFEEKLDGMRGLIVFDDNGLAQWNRSGENKGRLNAQQALKAEFEAMGKALPALYQGTVLDGEIYSKMGWNTTMHLAAQSGSNNGEGDLHFIVFDLPYLMGRNLKDQPWTKRRELLERLMAPFATANSLIIVSQLLPPDRSELQRIWDNGGEGVIIKRKDATYEPGGRHYWQKLKLIETAEAVITGYTPGQGKYADTIGAVELSQYVKGKLQKVTQVSGMTDEVRRSLTSADIGTVIEFEHYGKTVNTSYRHPQWKRRRTDKMPEDCTWEES
jgi:ATP-dependent DNA ligase